MKITAAQYSKSLYGLTVDKSKSEIDGVVAGLVKVMNKNRQIKLLPKIVEKFSELYNRENGIVEAEVITRDKMQDAKKIENFIKEKYQAKEVILKNKVDSDIKGGIVIKVGDEVMDASVARQLAELRINLAK